MTKTLKALSLVGISLVLALVVFRMFNNAFFPKNVVKIPTIEQQIETYDIKNIGPIRLGMTKSECSLFVDSFNDITYLDDIKVKGYKHYFARVKKSELFSDIITQSIEMRFYNDSLYSVKIISKNISDGLLIKYPKVNRPYNEYKTYWKTKDPNVKLMVSGDRVIDYANITIIVNKMEEESKIIRNKKLKIAQSL